MGGWSNLMSPVNDAVSYWQCLLSLYCSVHITCGSALVYITTSESQSIFSVFKVNIRNMNFVFHGYVRSHVCECFLYKLYSGPSFEIGQ